MAKSAVKELETFAPDTFVSDAARRHAEDNLAGIIRKASGSTRDAIVDWTATAKLQTTVGKALECLANCPTPEAAATYRSALQAELSRA